MSAATRPVDTYVTVCDLCDGTLPDGDPGEVGSITHGWIAHKVTEKTKRVWFIWPPANRERKMHWQERQKPENQQRHYDFHADCILRIVEDAIAARNEEDA